MKRFALAMVCVAILAPAVVFAYVSPGKPAGFVNDFAGVLSQQTRTALESELQKFAEGENPQIVVATIKTLQDDPIEDYANTLFREWGIGSKTKNNGVLFLIATEDRKMRIEVGYGMEGALTDIETKHIQENVVRPFFKSNDFDSGVRAGITAIEQGVKDELVVPTQKKSKGWSANSIEAIFFLVIFVFSWLGSILGRSKSWWAGGVLGGVVGGIAGLALSWLFWIPIGIGVGFVFDYFVSKTYKSSSGNPPWWIGGPWIGGGGGGGGFGGFGGGSSGGGGSSSSW